MKDLIFWGKAGEYGPFSSQEDGWPNAGEVVRYYRRERNMSAEQLATIYGEAVGEKITKRWILKMEQKNKVPVDITRRRILADTLQIPPLLLGLASIEQVTNRSVNGENRFTGIALVKHTSIDIIKYEHYVRDRWLLSYAGQEELKELIENIDFLKTIELGCAGSAQEHVRNVLNAYYQLASDILRHQGQFAEAWFFANEAVKVTNRRGISDFIAAALYRRGYISLEWSTFGEDTAHGIMNQEPDRKKIEAAIADFEAALPKARSQLRGAIWLELSRARGILKQNSSALYLANQAQEMVGSGNMNDPLEQILLEGALSGLNKGMYLVGKSAAFIAMGRTTTALDVLDELEDLKNGEGIVPNQTRRIAYIDTLRAEAYLNTKDYVMSAERARVALHVFASIKTIDRIAWINTIFLRLAQKYGHHAEVQALGVMLKEYYNSAKHKK